MVTLVTEVGSTGEDLGGGCRGCTPLHPEMTCSFLTQLVFCIKIGSYHQSVTPFLRGVPSTKRNPRSAPEAGGNNVLVCYTAVFSVVTQRSSPKNGCVADYRSPVRVRDHISRIKSSFELSCAFIVWDLAYF